MRKKLKSFLVIIFIPCLVFGQVNKSLSYTKKFIPIYNKEINSVKILFNSKEYVRILNQNNIEKQSNSEARTVGYSENVYIDFFKKATKIQTPNGINYALHFEIDSGVTFNFMIDTFIIPQGSSLIISDIEENIFEKYSYNTKFRQWNSKKVIVIDLPLKIKKELLMSITLHEDVPLSEVKLTIFKIGIHIFDFKTAIHNNINSSVISSTLRPSLFSSTSLID